eukprot:1420920-Amphidinium_carterae.5
MEDVDGGWLCREVERVKEVDNEEPFAWIDGELVDGDLVPASNLGCRGVLGLQVLVCTWTDDMTMVNWKAVDVDVSRTRWWWCKWQDADQSGWNMNVLGEGVDGWHRVGMHVDGTGPRDRKPCEAGVECVELFDRLLIFVWCKRLTIVDNIETACDAGLDVLEHL